MKKILIVDDSPQWISTHQFALQYHLGKSLNLDIANSAKQAYKCILENKSEPYDVIITDMEMEDDFSPLFAGEWLLQQIKSLKEYSNTKIYIASSVDNIEEIAKKYNVNFLPKDNCEDITSYDIF